MKKQVSFMLVLVTFLTACSSTVGHSVERTISEITTRLNSRLGDEDFAKIDQDFIVDFMTDDEKEALGFNYWRFHVNVPVVVSVMRDQNQKIVPYWLEASGFHKTEKTVSNDQTNYEVWQKAFPKGEVGLGINGFDKHRFVYFVSVTPQKETDLLELSPLFPEKQPLGKLALGQYTYRDWDQLVLTAVPESMEGQTLLTTFRGRAREAHLINANRKTPFPSSNHPDQILLTWNDDPSTSVVIQWRNALAVEESKLSYWVEGSQDTVREVAERRVLEDRLLKNDRYISRFMTKLSHLEPATTYRYFIESEGARSAVASFETAGSDDQFSFIWFGDTHNDEKWGKLLQQAHQQFPDVAFYSIAGDLVNTGLHRDDWDSFFNYSGQVFSSKPLMAVPGNHDSQDGLGASLFQRLLTYPTNGPRNISPGLTYAHTYKNALFLMLDVVSFSVEEQSAWIEQQLAGSDAQWKFVAFHFPPYNSEEEYLDIIDNWIPLFDKYKVDMVMNGHYHYYMRSLPMYNNKPVENIQDGTLYIMSVGTFIKEPLKDVPEPYAAVKFTGGYLFQRVQIDGNTLSYQSIDSLGTVRDKLVINK